MKQIIIKNRSIFGADDKKLLEMLVRKANNIELPTDMWIPYTYNQQGYGHDVHVQVCELLSERFSQLSDKEIDIHELFFVYDSDEKSVEVLAIPDIMFKKLKRELRKDISKTAWSNMNASDCYNELINANAIILVTAKIDSDSVSQEMSNKSSSLDSLTKLISSEMNDMSDMDDLKHDIMATIDKYKRKIDKETIYAKNPITLTFAQVRDAPYDVSSITTPITLN